MKPAVVHGTCPTLGSAHIKGFTLIEMSMVLIIIGLITGGILVGQDLITAAAARAQITQIEKYQTAVHAFQLKYDRYLPGDIPNPDAVNFGLQSRGAIKGMGDGNGVIEGIQGSNYNYTCCAQGTGETAAFWTDLSTAGLIEGGFSTASPSTAPASPPITGSGLDAYLPKAKIGNGNYVYVFSGGTQDPNGGGGAGDSTWFLPAWINFFGIEAITQINYQGDIASNLTIKVNQAYNIDKKIDDGIPVSGTVTFISLSFGSSVQITGSPTTCADARGDGNGYTSINSGILYSTEINNGTGANCGLRFQFQ